jgi:energy-coupling factor transporter ATP-binding protein EcfA2
MLLHQMPGHSHRGPLSPLRPDEVWLEARLARHVGALAVDVGERNVWRPGSLRAAAAYLEGALETVGPVARETWDAEGVPVENLWTFGRYQRLSGRALSEAVAKSLEWAGLSDRAKDRSGKLSGGMRRRLNIAAGTIHEPRLLLLDEPTVGVDPQSRERIYGMIGELRARGVSLLYTTHYMEEAERLCDRIAIIDHGRIIAAGTRDELVRSTLGDGMPVLLRTPPEQGVGSMYLAVLGWTEQRPSRLAQHADRLFRVKAQEVDRPDPKLFVPTTLIATYADVVADYDDYADVKARRETYDALLVTYGELAGGTVEPWPPRDA